MTLSIPHLPTKEMKVITSTVHLPHPNYHYINNPKPLTLCGRFPNRLTSLIWTIATDTNDLQPVTCRECIRILKSRNKVKPKNV